MTWKTVSQVGFPGDLEPFRFAPALLPLCLCCAGKVAKFIFSKSCQVAVAVLTAPSAPLRAFGWDSLGPSWNLFAQSHLKSMQLHWIPSKPISIHLSLPRQVAFALPPFCHCLWSTSCFVFSQGLDAQRGTEPQTQASGPICFRSASVLRLPLAARQLWISNGAGSHKQN